ncbi:ShlB/FhaC/HecB family hemolysin secretion/activation protein [Comamonas antarctica]|uniref:ShlB/FhaC/HecB family hemolysin secretion/activation protein n=1 Tax=Comamonas antarctica TaxID=2743470 RepID=A0A6N1XBG5_9BURK|nr:ShlB/FhaC/HecB family hemolysin secretion/activation protein [Comamonas antarctica]QKV55205.1 ShlB/FhaC/HecB family hemolysin secretion/activation protein [Comamonas antarctica]
MTENAKPSFLSTPLGLALGAVLAGLPAWASGQLIPNAGKVLESVEQQRLAPPAPPGIELRLPDAPEPSAIEAAGPAIDVEDFAIAGNRAIATPQLQALLQPLRGRSLTMAQLETALARITALYRSQGYPFAYAYLPEQTVEGGLVRVAVIEGHLGEVKLENASRQRPQVFAAPLSQLRSGDVLRADTLESSLLLLGDVNGVRARASLQPGAETGSADLVVKIEDQALASASLGLDNFGNRYTGANRATASLQLQGALGMGEQIQLQTLLSDEHLRNYQLAYQMPLGPWNTRIGASVSRLNYALAQEFEVLGAYGSADVASVYLSQPLVRRRAMNLNLRLQYAQKRLNDHVGLFGSEDARHSAVTTLSLDGNWQDRVGGGAVSQWSLAWLNGSLRLGSEAQERRDALTARSGGRFQVLTAGLSRWQALAGPWGLQGRVNGQWANRNLDSSEKMSLGGGYGVRAYPQGEGSGDAGLLATLELRYALPEAWQLSGFVDAGRVQLQRHPWIAGANYRSLSGTGVGLQRNGDGWSLETALAWRTSGQKAISAPDKSPRLWVRAQIYF